MNLLLSPDIPHHKRKEAPWKAEQACQQVLYTQFLFLLQTPQKSAEACHVLYQD